MIDEVKVLEEILGLRIDKRVFKVVKSLQLNNGKGDELYFVYKDLIRVKAKTKDQQLFEAPVKDCFKLRGTETTNKFIGLAISYVIFDALYAGRLTPSMHDILESLDKVYRKIQLEEATEKCRLEEQARFEKLCELNNIQDKALFSIMLKLLDDLKVPLNKYLNDR